MSLFGNKQDSGMASTFAFEALSLMDNEEFDQAIELLEKSISLNKRQADVTYNLGVCYLKKTLKEIMMRGGSNPPDAFQNFDKAEKYFLKTLKLKPGHTMAKNNLAQLREYESTWL